MCPTSQHYTESKNIPGGKGSTRIIESDSWPHIRPSNIQTLCLRALSECVLYSLGHGPWTMTTVLGSLFLWWRTIFVKPNLTLPWCTFYIPLLQSKMASPEFLPVESMKYSLLCYHLCPAQMSHAPTNHLLISTNAVTSPLCVNFFLLLLGLWRSLHAVTIQVTFALLVLWAQPSCLWPIISSPDMFPFQRETTSFSDLPSTLSLFWEKTKSTVSFSPASNQSECPRASSPLQWDAQWLPALLAGNPCSQ